MSAPGPLSALRRGRALDFGCGVGRLTQALALHFDAVTGVDISGPMLEHARAHNRLGERVTYVHNTRPDLACFADGSFDCITIGFGLRNVTDKAAALAAMGRLLKPGGQLLVLEFSQLAVPALQ